MSQNNRALPVLKLAIDDNGWCPAAEQVQSPNFNARDPAGVVDLLIIHNISLPPGQFGGPHIRDLFCNQLDYKAHPYFEQLQQMKVSAHFLIRRDGTLLQFVSTHQRAWHAGISVFEGRQDCNNFSIGIELEGTDFVPFEHVQYQVLANLTHALRNHHGLKNIAGHQHIAAGRKTDPGPCFDWDSYHQTYIACCLSYSLTADADTKPHFPSLLPSA